MFIKVPRPSLDSWSKALLKAREAQAIMVKADPVNEDLWEKNSKRGMDALKQRCKGEFSPSVIPIDINPIVSRICSRSAPLQIGMKTI